MQINFSNNYKCNQNLSYVKKQANPNLYFKGNPCGATKQPVNTDDGELSLYDTKICSIYNPKAKLKPDTSGQNEAPVEISMFCRNEKLLIEQRKTPEEFRKQKEAELETFSASLNDKTKVELEDLSKILQEESDRLNKTSIQNQHSAGILDANHTDSNYLFGEDKISYEFLLKKEGLLAIKQTELDNKMLYELLHRDGDKKVNVPRNSAYLSREELCAFYDYYDDDCTINREIRNAKGQLHNETLDLMNSGFKKAPELEEEAVVYRAIIPMQFSKQSEIGKFIDSIKENEVIHDHAFISTSATLADAQFRQFARCAISMGGVLMRIHLPVGTKGVLGGHNEYLLPRETDLRVLSVDVKDGTKIAECEYILP